MNKQRLFPTRPLAQGMSEPAIDLEGQKVLFDKKVSLLPIDIKIESHGHSGR